MLGIIKHYKWDLLITLLAVTAVAYGFGLVSAGETVVLILLEITFSFDNAYVNSEVLARMSHKWRLVFLTVGMLVAVGFMRLLFPILVVKIPTGLPFGEVINLALHNPEEYERQVELVHPQIAIIGGIFLLMIFLNWIFESKDVFWLAIVEKPLAAASKLNVAVATVNLMTTGIAAAVILAISFTVDSSERSSLLWCGFGSLFAYLVVNAINSLLDKEDAEDAVELANKPLATGMQAFGLFLYLEAQDAAFSFDGVSGAFAITNNIILIAVGLGVGALFVRSMTLHLLESGKLAELRFLGHGAHWAIGTLAAFVLISIFHPINEFITGCIGIIFIAIAVFGSIRANKREQSEGPVVDDEIHTVGARIEQLDAYREDPTHTPVPVRE
jgi:hypothetical protein